ALADDGYCRSRQEILERNHLNVWALGAHLVGQAVCDRIDVRHRAILPPEIYGDGEPEGVRTRAAERMKDTARAAARLGVQQVNGRRSILGSHLNFGEEARGWDFVSPGHGDVDFEAFFRALNRIGYQGPLSIEWEDSGMDREYGAQDALAFVRRTDFSPSGVAFDAAMQKAGA